MPSRPFELPADLDVLIDLVPRCFQYPENPDWGVQEDEAESLVDGLRGVKRIWWLVRVMGVFWPPLRDILRGFVWEEHGKAVGLVNVMRTGATDRWTIGNVAVLPEYRRRGIARQLVQAAVDYAQQRGARAVILNVLDGNVPAYRLYESLGFEPYSGMTELIYEQDGPPPPRPFPDGYTWEPRPLMDWRPRYELAQRITPEHVRGYQPVEEGRFRQPTFFRPLLPIIFRAMGSRPLLHVLQSPQGQIVATASAQVRTRKGGVNGLELRLDPAHKRAAPALLTALLREIAERSPGRRVECALPHWQHPLVEAALALGFRKRSDMHTMGMLLAG